MFEQELIPGTYALRPHFTPLGHTHVMDMFRPFDNQHPALQPLFHHRFVEDGGLGDGDDEGEGVVLVSADLVEGIDGVEVGVVGSPLGLLLREGGLEVSCSGLRGSRCLKIRE